MYNLTSLKLRMQNHPSLQECFIGMPFDTSPDFGGQNVLTFEMAIDIGLMILSTRKSFLSLELFSLAFRTSLWPFYVGGGRSPPMDPPLASSNL